MAPRYAGSGDGMYKRLENAETVADQTWADIAGEYEDEGVGQHNYDDSPLQTFLATTRPDVVKAMAGAVTGLMKGVSNIKFDVSKDVRDEPPTRPADFIACQNAVFWTHLKSHTAKLQSQYGSTARRDM
ncbi:hypothetical protein PHYPSEUDO_012841 [Phytophthora pseudosyringae]|uniref:Uncharacterized protein n=1 Tax=Phytophthora pseudosyringae TaxID=221518 RepID=A0A8T1V6U6_9STRA|nr:hypothetical protein PHYPSEUDO_012841 [Phytophthora pseudosyringae]